ncbi:MAG: 6-phosphogluconolactonase [Anaerolineae bacterium]
MTQVVADSETLAQAAAALFADLAQQAVALRGTFSVALSGGTTPGAMFRLLGAEPYRSQLPWQKIHLFWADERSVPPGDPGSNYRLAHDTLIARVPLPSRNVHRIHGEANPEDAARTYQQELRAFFGSPQPRFDLVLLGMGQDGHTASLFPGAATLEEARQSAVPATADYDGRPSQRVTLTLPALNGARNVVFLVSGKSKADALARVWSGERLPAGLIQPSAGRLTWLVDATAARAERVIFDCDNTLGLRHKEIDDGLALLYLLGRSDIALLGVTTTFGNGSVDEAYTQTRSLVDQLGRQDVPVLNGEGRRGQGPTEAARFLVKQAAAYPGEITLLATGPLGNLRAAAELDPNFFVNLKHIVSMGGYFYPLRIGRRDLPELNLSSDPEAAWTVLNSGCPTTMMNAHICLQAPFGWRDLWHIRHWGRGMRRVVTQWLLVWAYYFGLPKFYLWDLVPAVYLSYPELFDENPVHVSSSVGDLEMGTLVANHQAGGTLINLPERILEVDRFRQVLFETWRRVDARAVHGVGS